MYGWTLRLSSAGQRLLLVIVGWNHPIFMGEHCCSNSRTKALFGTLPHASLQYNTELEQSQRNVAVGWTDFRLTACALSLCWNYQLFSSPMSWRNLGGKLAPIWQRTYSVYSFGNCWKITAWWRRNRKRGLVLLQNKSWVMMSWICLLSAFCGLVLGHLKKKFLLEKFLCTANLRQRTIFFLSFLGHKSTTA